MTIHRSSFSRDEIGKMGIELYLRCIRATIINLRYTRTNVIVLWVTK